MKSKLLLLIAILIAVISSYTVSCGKATLSGTVFGNIVVGISTAVQSNKDANAIDQILQNLQKLLKSTSNAMYKATGNRLSFDSGIILVPATWDSVPPSRRTKRSPGPFPPDYPTFETADIRVDLANRAYGDTPYTQQTGFCEEKGDFIHITDAFINAATDNNGDKYLAREWIKYFFGVFDEQGYSFSEMYPVKYFADQGTAILNSCNNTNVDWNTDDCYDSGPASGLPAYCILDADNDNGRNPELNSSMMSLPIATITDHFCNETNHNAYAPNKQNVMCDGRSIMEVVLSHPELINSEPQGDTPPTVNNFQINKIDFTNLMRLGVLLNINTDHTWAYSASPALSKFIKYDMPQNSYIKLETSDTATVIDWKQLKSDSDRDTFIASLPDSPSSATQDLSSVFNNLIQGMTTNDINAVVIISEQNDVTNLCSIATQNNIQLHLISYDGAAVGNFIDNSECIGQAIQIQSPQSPFGDDVWAQEVQDCYGHLMERKQIDDFIRALPNVISSAVYGPPQTFYERTFFDSAADVFYLSEPIYSSTTSMTDRLYYETCENLAFNTIPKTQLNLVKCTVNFSSVNITCSLDADAHTVCGSQTMNSSRTQLTENVFSCTAIASNITSTATGTAYNQKAPYVLYVVGQPASSVVDPDNPPITLNQWVVTNDALSYTNVRIFAKLTNGTTPIFDANVFATVTSGAKLVAQSINITLRDDGSGNPDITAMDGIYSAYYTQFGSSTTYTVTVTATDNGGNAYYPTVQYPWITNQNNYQPEWTPGFIKVGSAGTFKATTTTGPSIPPGRILDLRVVSSDSGSVTLAWTAPGKDLDYGKVDDYLIKCSASKNDLSSSNFQPNQDQASNIPTVTPWQPGTTQTVKIGGSPDGVTYYCAVLAISNDDNTNGNPSNIVSYSIMQYGLTSGQIAGISIGVIILVVIMVLLGIFLFYKFSHKSSKSVATGNLHSSPPNNDKLTPINVPMEAIHHVGNGDENENPQRRSRPNSTHINNSSFSSSDVDHGSQHNSGLLTFQSSRSSSPKPVPLPKIPTPPLNHPIQIMELGSPPSDKIIYNAKPHLYDDALVYAMENPDVARPVRLTQKATLEDTGDYQDHNTFKPDNHHLNKPPIPPPKKMYAANESFSSTSTSSSDHTNRTPKLNSAV